MWEMFKFNENTADNGDHQTFNGSSLAPDPAITPDSEKKVWLDFYRSKHWLIWSVWITVFFCIIPPPPFLSNESFLGNDYLVLVDVAQDWALGYFDFFYLRVVYLVFCFYMMLATRDFFLFMSFNNNNIPSALTLHLRSLIYLLFQYFSICTLLIIPFSQIPFLLFPKWLGMGTFQENINQIKLNDFSIFLEWFPVTFTEILMLIPIYIFILWSIINCRKGFLLYLRYNSLNIACALAFITGYHYLASYLSFSIFDITQTISLLDIYQVSYPSASIFGRTWPPVMIIVYLVVATALYFCIAWRNIRQAISNIDEIYFYGKSPRHHKIIVFISKFFSNIWFILLCFVAVILWNFYEGWSVLNKSISVLGN